MQIAFVTLEKAINAYLNLDPTTVQRVARLEGKIAKIEFVNLPITFYMGFSDKGVVLFEQYDAPVDMTIKGSALNLLKASFKKETTEFLSVVKIEGDVELGQQLSQILREIDIDWEEHLSHIVGDVAAHQLNKFFRSAQSWQQQFVRSLQYNLTEFLQEEARYLPPRLEVEDFFNDITVLSHDVERLAARLQHLTKHVKK